MTLRISTICTLGVCGRLERSRGVELDQDPTRPDQTRLDPTTLDQTRSRPDQTRPPSIRPDQDPTRPDQTRPPSIRPDQDPTRPDQTRSDPTRPDQTRPDPIKLKLLHSAPGQFCQSRGETGSRCPHVYVCVRVCVCVGIVLSPIGNETL